MNIRLANGDGAFSKTELDGLLDEVRPGRPRTIDDDQIAAVIERTLRSTPSDATHWSIRSMAGATGFSHTTIRRIWNAFGLQPHRTETFKLSSDPLFVDKVRDIVGLYLSPPNRALVLSVDEKSQIQALDREQPVRGDNQGETRIASPELLPENGLLPHLNCSRRINLGSCDEEGKHGDTCGIGGGDQLSLCIRRAGREGEDVG